MRPIEPTCTRSSRRSPRFAYGRAIDTTNGMYASIRRSRAERSPSSRYARSNSADELHERANRSAATIVISLVDTVDISKCIFKSRGCTQRTLGSCFSDGLVFARRTGGRKATFARANGKLGRARPAARCCARCDCLCCACACGREPPDELDTAVADRSIGSRRHCRCRCGSGARRDRSGVRYLQCRSLRLRSR